MIDAERKCRQIKSEDSIFTRISTLDPMHTSLQVPIMSPTWPYQQRRQSKEDRKEVLLGLYNILDGKIQ